MEDQRMKGFLVREDDYSSRNQHLAGLTDEQLENATGETDPKD